MSETFAVNGRFLSQAMTGVQRYARNVVAALDACLAAAGEKATLIAPRGADAVALQALDRLDTGVLMVDGAGRIIQASSMAERLLHDNAELAVIRGRLALRPPALHDKLLALVRGAMDTARGRITNPGAAISIPRPLRMPLALEVAPLRPSVSAFGEQRPAVLVFIRDPEAPIAAARLRELFGLTRTEAAVAAALGRGTSLEDIAVNMGIGLATVRSHLKRILAKTGTHRQAEAVALLARSVSTVSNH